MTDFVKHFPTNWQNKWEEKGFTVPSFIQQEVFTDLKEGKSLIAVSPTGSGKTLAYLYFTIECEKRRGKYPIDPCFFARIGDPSC